ncbi:NHLP leader peptide family RiPP precursor [Streptomyces sp. NPDC002138]|uniref:NHLP leader peptide family RiPP precursor n=1 Tax=Streptomyces sp. NPDC002138 TaxID=3154410 RepID=UPI00332440F9
MSRNTVANRQELERTIVARAEQDPGFRERLIADPQATVLNELGISQLPDSPQWRVLEEDGEVLYLVLPVNRERVQEIVGGADALSDGELSNLRAAGMNAMLKCSPGSHSDED